MLDGVVGCALVSLSHLNVCQTENPTRVARLVMCVLYFCYDIQAVPSVGLVDCFMCLQGTTAASLSSRLYCILKCSETYIGDIGGSAIVRYNDNIYCPLFGFDIVSKACCVVL